MKVYAILKRDRDEQHIIEIRMRENNHELEWNDFANDDRQKLDDPTRSKAQIWLSMRLIDIVYGDDTDYILEVHQDRFGFIPKGILSDFENVIRMQSTDLI